MATAFIKLYSTQIILSFYYNYFLVPAILNEAVPATTQNVQTEIANSTQLAFKYTSEYGKNEPFSQLT